MLNSSDRLDADDTEAVAANPDPLGHEHPHAATPSLYQSTIVSATTTRHNRNTDSLHVSAHDAQTVNFLDDYPNTIIGNGYSSDGASSTLPFEESYWSIPVDYQCDTSYTDLLTGSSNPSTYTNSPVSQDDELKPYLNPPIHDRSLPTNQPEMRAWPQYRNNGSDYPVTNPFDIFKALDLLFSRAAPLFNLNNMVESQSFLITENWLPGSPIAYVSEGFEALTGYDRTEVIGKNPRFLQSPDGKAEPDSRRDLAVGSSAQELKEKIALGREVQHGIMNYRKNGEPIMIVLTLIPIPWDASGVIRFWFGFQNELLQGQAPFRLVLSPNEQGSLLHRRSRAISSGNSSSLCDASAIDTDETPVMNVVLGGTSPDVPHAGMSSASPEQYYEHQYGSSVTSPSYLLPALANAVGEDQKKQLLSSNAWNNMILENLDGFVQILSLKGTIVHLSPACSKLWYNASQLLGSSVETICHPSDVLAVRRELKHASSNKEIDMVFRIKHKNGDHFWYHNYGSVWNDGTRRWAVLVGRQLDMFSLGSEAMSQRGGFGDRDIWMKISTSGLILSAFPNPQPALGMTVRELIGTSFQNLLDTDFPPDRFQRLLQSARRGNVASTSVVLQSSRGHRLNAEMTLHPGGAPESAKAYFLLAQCSIKAVIRKGAISRNPTAAGAIELHPLPRKGVSDENILAGLEPDECGVWLYDLHQIQASNNNLKLELQNLEKLSRQRKRSRVSGNAFRGCANCHTRQTPEWRRGPSGVRDLCNSCGLRWAKSLRRDQPKP